MIPNCPFTTATNGLMLVDTRNTESMNNKLTKHELSDQMMLLELYSCLISSAQPEEHLLLN